MLVSGTGEARRAKGVRRVEKRTISRECAGMACVLVKWAGFDICHANLTIMRAYAR